MANGAKFLFDRSFDTANEERRTPPKPTFGEVELEAARKTAFAEGHAAGSAAAKAEQRAAIMIALQTIEGALAELLRQQTHALSSYRDDVAKLSMAIARKLSISFASRAATEEVEALLRKCIEEQHDEPRLVVRASEAVIEALKPRVAAIGTASGYGGQIVLLPDDCLENADCQVQWADGGAERNFQGLVEQIEAIITRNLAT